MRCLTVRQPWAEAIACGAKLVENRSMGTRYRGPLAIHAGSAWARWGTDDPRLDVLAALPPTWTPKPDGYRVQCREWLEGGPVVTFVMGAVIAAAELVGCHPAAGCCKPWGEDHYAASDGKRVPEVFHWMLEDVRRLEAPIPAKGRLGLWAPGRDLLDELRLEWPHAARTGV